MSPSNDPILEVSDPQPEAILAHLNDLLDKDPNNSKIYFQKARIYNKIGNPAQALHAVDRAIQIEYSHPKYFLLKGEILTALNKPGEAIGFLLRAEAAGDKNRRLYSLLAQNYLAQGSPDQARKAVDRLLKIDESDASHVLAGHAYRAMGDTLLALAQFKRAVALNKINLEAHAELAKIYLFRNSVKQAEREIDFIIRLEPDNVYFLRERARSLMNRRSYDSARQIYEKVSTLAGDHLAYHNLAEVYYRKGDYDSANLMIDKSIALDSKIVDSRLLKARILNRLSDYSGSMKVYSAIIGQDSTNNLALAELDNLKRKVSYLQRLEQRRRAVDSALNSPPPALNRKEIEN